MDAEFKIVVLRKLNKIQETRGMSHYYNKLNREKEVNTWFENFIKWNLKMIEGSNNRIDKTAESMSSKRGDLKIHRKKIEEWGKLMELWDSLKNAKPVTWDSIESFSSIEKDTAVQIQEGQG